MEFHSAHCHCITLNKKRDLVYKGKRLWMYFSRQWQILLCNAWWVWWSHSHCAPTCDDGRQAAGCLQSHSNLKILSSRFQLILLPSSANHRNHENGSCSTSSSCGCSAVCFNPSSGAKLLVSAKHNNLPQPQCKEPSSHVFLVTVAVSIIGGCNGSIAGWEVQRSIILLEDLEFFASSMSINSW
jgi:hypothetical protein